MSELEPSGCGGAQWHDVGEGLIRLCGRDFLREPARHQVTQHCLQAADDPIPGSAQVAVGHRGVPRLQALDRGSTSPSEVLSINYDRRETLAAMGVIPRPYYARRGPQPFPGTVTFVPDPR